MSGYLEPTVLDVTDDADALARLTGMHRQPTSNDYRAQAFRVDVAGTRLQDVSATLRQESDSSVRYDTTAANQQGCTLALSSTLSWGSDILALYQLIRNRGYNAAHGLDPETFVRFPLGHHVITTPGFTDLDDAVAYSATGYGKNYLLQSALDDAYVYATVLAGGAPGPTTDTYFQAVQDLFRGSGVIAPTAALSTVCDYPGDFPSILFTALTYFTPTGGGGTSASPATFLEAINSLLHTCGYAPLQVQDNGRWLIEPVLDAVAQPVQWEWWASAGVASADLAGRIVFRHATYSGDVYNVPNEWHFVPDGYSGVGGFGIAYVNNNVPPAGKLFTGRTVKKYQAVQVGPDTGDLATQSQKIVTDDMSAVEKLTFNTAPWPIAGDGDVFLLHHSALPYRSVRKVRALQWSMPLFGGPMQWSVNAVASVVAS